MEIAIFVAILFLAFFLFVREIFPLEISALFILVLLVATGIVPTDDAFENFGNQSLVLIGSLFVLTAGLKKTGIIKKIELQLSKIGGDSRTISFIVILVLVAMVSAFISNTATLAVAIPIVVSISRSFGDSPSQWLMPVAFASVLGGINSLIGTSTNIIISSMLPQYHLESFSLFTTATVGLPILVLGVIYLCVTSRFLLPQKKGEAAQSVDLKYNLRAYTAELVIGEDSPLCDKSIENSPLFREVDITVLGVVRPNTPVFTPRSGFIMRALDRLIVEGNIEKLTEVTDKYGLRFIEEARSESASVEKTETEQNVEFYEVLVTSQSILHNRRPAGVFLRNRYRMSLIAINRQGVTLHEKLSEVKMLSGDILVVQFLGYVDNNTLDHLGLVPLQILTHERYLTSRAPVAAALFILALLVGSLTHLTLPLTCLAGAVLMVMFRIIRPQEVYEAVEWRVLLFIGAVLCLGRGMDASGTAAYLGDFLSTFFVTMDPLYSLGFFFLITSVMTQLLSNQATAVVMIPVAINTALNIDLDPMPFVMAVTIAASTCFVTPFEPAFMLVYGPGEYKFSDFFKLGILLNVLAFILAMYLIPIYWPLINS